MRHKRIRVECPDCGSGGASEYICWCHVCEERVMMLPMKGNTSMNWSEHVRFNKIKHLYSPSLTHTTEVK